jgi:hypothetical protein
MKMNTQRVLIGFLALLLAACNQRVNQLRAFIPGTYVKTASGEFSKATDTLVLTLISGNNYRIERHTAYQLIRDGKLLSEMHHREVLSAAFDEQRQVLVETSKGRQFSFDVDKGLLVVNGKGVYDKLR